MADVLRSVEDLLAGTVTACCLAPKTLLRAARDPAGLAAYVADQAGEPSAAKFDAYTPPLLLLTAVAALSVLLRGPDVLFGDRFGADAESRVLAGVVSSVSGPLGYALEMLIVARRPLTRTALSYAFAVQCYCHAPPMLLMTVAHALLDVAGWGPQLRGRWDDPYFAAAVVGTTWLALLEYRLAMPGGRRRALRFVARGWLRGGALALLVVLTALALNASRLLP